MLSVVFLGSDFLGLLGDMDIDGGGVVPRGCCCDVDLFYDGWGLDDVVEL